MQVEHAEDTRNDVDTRRGVRRRGKPKLESSSFATQNSKFDSTTFTNHLAVDLASGLIEAFARDYSESDRDHALAELLFSVSSLKTDYERLAAGAALESLAGRIEAGIREYPHLTRAAEALADGIPSGTPGDNPGRASHVAKAVIRPIAAELSKSSG